MYIYIYGDKNIVLVLVLYIYIHLTARKLFGWVKFMESDKELYTKMFPLMLKGPVNKSYARTGSLYESETWCQKKAR